MNSNDKDTESKQEPPKPRRLWLWFFAGFLAAFLVMAILWPTYFFDGNSGRRTVLGHYYLLEIQLQLNASGNLGPTSSNLATALTTLATHLVLAAFAGSVAMGGAWFFQKRSR